MQSTFTEKSSTARLLLPIFALCFVGVYLQNAHELFDYRGAFTTIFEVGRLGNVRIRGNRHELISGHGVFLLSFRAVFSGDVTPSRRNSML